MNEDDYSLRRRATSWGGSVGEDRQVGGRGAGRRRLLDRDYLKTTVRRILGVEDLMTVDHLRLEVTAPWSEVARPGGSRQAPSLR